MFPTSVIPPARLKRYQKYFTLEEQTNDNIRAVYLWNLALSQQLMPVISLLEVSLRNKIDRAITCRFGESWLDQGWQYLQDTEKKRLKEAVDKLCYASKQITHDDLVAQLSFGFWVKMFDGKYRQPVWYQPNMQQRLFDDTKYVCYLQSQNWVGSLYGDLKTLQNLRNRMFHHEAIFELNKHRVDLLHSKATVLLQALCKDTHHELHAIDNFTQVWAKGRGWQSYRHQSKFNATPFGNVKVAPLPSPLGG
jgi:hypothetical protein